jgi:outer membrane lipoprotein-sorting protein
MGDLGNALALIHKADEDVQTLRLTIRRVDSRIPARFFTGSDAPIEWVSRVWIEKPDRLRVQHDDSFHGHELQIQNGARYWAYSRDYGLHSGEDERMIGTIVSNEAGLLLDPSDLLGLRLELLGRATIAGREALQLRSLPASEQTSSRALGNLVGYGVELPTLEVAVDAERGILLQYASSADGQPQGSTEVIEVTFDESFVAETFVWMPSPDRPLPEHVPAPQEPVGPQEVSLEEAGRLASFPVFALDLPEQWHCYPSYKPEQPWKYKGPRPPFFAEAVFLEYHLADASHQFRVEQSAANGSGGPVSGQGVWKPREYEGHSTWVWTTSDDSSGARSPANIRLERDGTMLTINSMTLETDQLLQLTGLLRRVV